MDSPIERAARSAGALGILAELTAEQVTALPFAWQAWARPEQLAPSGDWLTWLLLAGRGFGKSRTGAEWVREQAREQPGTHGALVAPTAADARDVMVKALIGCTPPWEGLRYEPSKRSLTWSNGSTATLYSAEEPDRLRGPQHHWAWADEIAAWQYADEVWDMLQMTMRLGDRPRVVVSTTPRPIEILRGDGQSGRRLGIMRMADTAITRGSTFDNATNLSPTFIASVKQRYDGTRLGRQELYAEVLDDIEGSLWKHSLIDRSRRTAVPALQRIVVAVDPSGSAKRTADEAGIVVAGLGDCACLGRIDKHGFVLEDLTGRYSPQDMGRKAVDAYHKYRAHRLVAEDNFGGKIIEDIIRLIDPTVAYKAVHASRGKIVRAEPVAALYEQGRVHHIGLHRELEDEMCGYAPLVSTESPGRMDALVWALTDLMLGQGRASFDDDTASERRV